MKTWGFRSAGTDAVLRQGGLQAPPSYLTLPRDSHGRHSTTCMPRIRSTSKAQQSWELRQIGMVVRTYHAMMGDYATSPVRLDTPRKPIVVIHKVERLHKTRRCVSTRFGPRTVYSNVCIRSRSLPPLDGGTHAQAVNHGRKIQPTNQPTNQPLVKQAR
jgi:hypothetical protein